MRGLIIIACILFFFENSYSQKTIYLDENVSELSKSEHYNKWTSNKMSLTRWHYVGDDNNHYAILKDDLYHKGNFEYDNIKTQIEKIIYRSIPDSTIILLEYAYKDDFCFSKPDNHWSKSEITKRKNFMSPYRKQFNNKNIFYIVLFEEGIVLKNSPNRKREYFYSDENNFFRELIFKFPTLCGSFALIKPNGQTLIRNGEYRADDMAEHLNPEIWNPIFEIDEDN